MALSSNLGNTSPTSLLRSASTIQASITAFNDKQASDTFNYSAQTDADLQVYLGYLNGRINTLSASGSITDATKALDLQSTGISATKTTQSSNIRQSTINILDGTGSNNDKLAALGNAYQNLYAIGDYSSAQAYEEQYYSFSQTVQQQNAAAASALAAAGASTASEMIDGVKTIIGNANYAFAQQGPSFMDKASSDFLKSQGIKVDASTNIFASLAGATGMVNQGIQLNDNTKYAQGTYTPGSQLDIYTQAMILDPSKATTYQSDIDGILEGRTGIALPGGTSITYNALMNTVYAGNSGAAPYETVKEADGTFGVKPGNVSGYSWGTDQNGQPKLMAQYSFFTPSIQGQNADGTVTKGSQAAAFKNAGLNVKQDSNGDWWFQATQSSGFMANVLGTSTPVQGALQPNGNVEFVNQSGNLVQMTTDKKGLVGFQSIDQFGNVQNANLGGEYGFTPTNKAFGSNTFLTKVLGSNATPTVQNGTTYYQKDGKTYKVATDANGIKGLQEVDPKTGKVTNANVAGQYGFNPNPAPTSPKKGQPQSSGNSAKVGGSGPNPFDDIKNNPFPGSFDAAGNLKNNGALATSHQVNVQDLVNISQILNSANVLHQQTLLATAPPLQQPILTITAPPPAPAPIVAQPKASPLAGLGSTPQTIQQTANPQGGGTNGAGINQSSGSGIKITGTTNAPVGIKI